MCWSIVLAVKLLSQAKSRLAVGVPGGRADLALAMTLDTVAAACAAHTVGAVIVVTDDPLIATELTRLDIVVIADQPQDGLNPALRHGAEHAARCQPQCGVAAIVADLPALRPDELDRALSTAAGWPRAIVADATGAGTTLLTALPGEQLRPAYGPASRARHVASGAMDLSLPDVPGLQRDVDTLADLAQARILGLGPHTAAVLDGRAP